MSLSETLIDPRHPLALYGTTPPRADAPPARLDAAAGRLAERVAGLGLDGVVVYDVQDEAGRTSEPRPFPFLPTYDPRTYAERVVAAAGVPVIAYKCVAQMTEAGLRDWLRETGERNVTDCVSLVGQATSTQPKPAAGLTLLQAMRIASEQGSGFLVGGVAIPERHSPTRSEAARLMQKSRAGASYFISQAIYSPNPVIALCRDYARDCADAGIAPRRMILTFTPCGRPQTLRFMKWLGITVPTETEQAILSAADPLAESLRVCAESLRRIVDSGVGADVPLGINVESVSINKEEIAGSIELCRMLAEIVRG